MILVHINGIPGDSKIAKFEEYFTADSFSFGVERELAESGGKGGTQDINIGVGELQECSISKSMDTASTWLARKAISGSSCGTADIKFVEAIEVDGKRKNVVYLAFQLDTVFVKSWSISGDADDRPTEGSIVVQPHCLLVFRNHRRQRIQVRRLLRVGSSQLEALDRFEGQ